MKRLRIKAFMIIMLILTCGLFMVACDKEKKNMITLTFETYDGPEVASEVVQSNTSYTLPEPSSWEHHYFEGWFLTENFESSEALPSTYTIPEQDTTLYAKWTKEYSVEFNLNGGTISNSDVWIKEGENILDALTNIIPQKSGVTFDSWYFNGQKLTSDQLMEGNITLEAKWTVEYTIEIYTQDLNDNETYQLKETTNASGIVGSSVQITAPEMEGYHLVNKDETIDKMTLTDQKEQNVFHLYYDRNEYRLTYDANLPEDVVFTGGVNPQRALYESVVTVLDSSYVLETKGYLFAGWSKEANGSVEYKANDTITLTDNITLYAVWDVAYIDAWGGVDYIYVLQNEEGKVLLERLDEVYEGVISSDGVFTVAGMTGKVYDHYFAYYREDFKDTFYYLDGYYHEDKTIELIHKDASLTLDGYLEATYTYLDGNNIVTEKGFYGYDEDNQSYYFQFEDGTRKDFRIGTYKDTPVFAFKGQEEGLYDEFQATSPTGGVIGDYTILLDGYGSVMLGNIATQEYVEGAYSIEESDFYYGEEPIYFYNVYTENGTYQFYNYPLISDVLVLKDQNEATYTGEVEGKSSSLTLNGLGLLLGAEFNQQSYNYYITESNVFGKLLNLYDENFHDVMTLRLLDDSHTFEEFDGSFVEYLYLRIDENEQANLFYPIVLIYDETSKDGKRAEIYSINDQQELYHAATCDYVANQELYGYTYYTLTLKEFHGEDKAIFPVSEDDFQSASIIFNEGTLIVDVYYILEYNDEPLYQSFQMKNGGNERLWIGVDTGINGLGSFYINENNEVIEGRVTQSYTNIQAFGMTAVRFTYRESGTSQILYLALYDDFTFRTLDYEPYQAQLLDEYGTQKQQAGVYFDGLGNGYYFATGTDFYDNNYISGMVLETEEKTALGTSIWEIRSSVGSLLKFVLEQYTEVTYLCYPYYEHETEIYGTDDTEMLILDGYNYMAQYTDSKGNLLTGEYHLLNSEDVNIPSTYEKAYVMQLSDALFLRFYMKEDGTYDTILSVLGNMDEGFIMVMDDSYNSVGMMIVSLEDMECVTTYMSMSDENVMGFGATFEIVSVGERVEVSLELAMMNGETEEMWAETLILSDFENSACVILNDKVAGNYQTNASKLTLDGYGYATYMDLYGFYYDGAYVVFTDTDYIAFESKDGGESIVIRLNHEDQSLEEINLKPYYATYVAEDGSTISFEEYFYINQQASGFWYYENNQITFMVYDDSIGIYTLETFEFNQSTITYKGVEYQLQ